MTEEEMQMKCRYCNLEHECGDAPEICIEAQGERIRELEAELEKVKRERDALKARLEEAEMGLRYYKV